MMDLVKIDIQAPQTHIIGQALFVKYSITNISKYEIAVLKWFTPLEGLKADIFDIRSQGNYRFVYDGKMSKRGLATGDSYVRIGIGKTVSANVDITQCYFINSEDEIKISLKNHALEIIVLDNSDKENLIGKTNFEPNSYLIETPTISTTISGEKKPKLTLGMQMRQEFRGSPRKKKIQGNKDKLSSDTKKPKFVGGSATKKTTVEQAHEKAHSFTKKSLNNLKTDGSQNQEYKKWFGKHTETRYKKVKDNYGKVNLAYSDDTITYDLSETGCDSGDFAYTYKGTYKIWLCEGFWNAGTSGFDSQFGTLIHEMMHCISYVDDIVYGVSKAKELALKKPNDAVKNADNYEYFSETI